MQDLERDEAVEAVMDACAREFGPGIARLSYEVSPNDRMFDGRFDHYLRLGLSAIRCIRRGLDGRFPDSILDFGCGHGRVLRALQVTFPAAEITGADIDPDAVQFCRDVLGAQTFLSAAEPESIQATGTFALIWVGSVFTNLDAPRWTALLPFLESRLLPDGVLVFTFLGPTAAERLRLGQVKWAEDFRPEKIQGLLANFGDFSYTDYPDRDDYGISLSTVDWVKQTVESRTSLVITDYNVDGWDGQEDVVTAVKPG